MDDTKQARQDCLARRAVILARESGGKATEEEVFHEDLLQALLKVPLVDRDDKHAREVRRLEMAMEYDRRAAAKRIEIKYTIKDNDIELRNWPLGERDEIYWKERKGVEKALARIQTAIIMPIIRVERALPETPSTSSTMHDHPHPGFPAHHHQVRIVEIRKKKRQASSDQSLSASRGPGLEGGDSADKKHSTSCTDSKTPEQGQSVITPDDPVSRSQRGKGRTTMRAASVMIKKVLKPKEPVSESANTTS